MSYLTGIRAEILQQRYGFKLASYLNLSSQELPHNISERLRIARIQAVEASQKKSAVVKISGAIFGAGSSATMGWQEDHDRLGIWQRIGLVIPALTLILGLLFINVAQDDNRAQELAEIDSALLTDELPPAAFADPGFVQFLTASPADAMVQ